MIKAACLNAHMAETMWLHYDERIHHHATPAHIIPLLQKHQRYWEEMYLRETARNTPVKDIIKLFS